MHKSAYLKTLQTKLQECETKLAEFKKDLESNPRYAFEWSHIAMRALAEIYVISSMIPRIEKLTGVRALKQLWLEGAAQHACAIEESTSEQANAMSRYVAQAFAQKYRDIEFYDNVDFYPEKEDADG